MGLFGKKKKEKVIVGGFLVSGLPERENSDLMLELFDDHIHIKSFRDFKNEYKISLDKVTNVKYYNESQIEKVITQSTPGMIIGAATFGAVGAMIGGRVKTKEKKTTLDLLLIKYDDKEFCMRITYYPSVKKFIDKIIGLKPSLDDSKEIIEL